MQKFRNRNKNVILPNMITLLNLLCGIYAMVASIEGNHTLSAAAIIIAAVFDGLDGKVARLVNATSEFGVQLDSLADEVSFGVAPALLMYNWMLKEFDQVGVMVVFLFAACGALRLARFNVQTKIISNVFFVGIPIPGAAAVIASWVFFVYRAGLEYNSYLPGASLFLTAFLSFLMVSTIPYFSFKNVSFLRPKQALLLIVIILALVGMNPKVTIFVTLMLYIVSGFVLLPFRKRILLKLDKEHAEA